MLQGTPTAMELNTTTFCKALVLLFSPCFSYVMGSSEQSETKCSEEREGPETFDSCAVNYVTMVMWCDLTEFETILHPSHPDIKTQTPAKRVTTIYHNDSCLTSLDKDSLKHYSYLEVFNCHDNLLKKIDANTFSGNIHLRVLILSHNLISVIDDRAFTGLNDLRELDLGSNLLQNVGDLMFQDLHSLETLDLSNNRISVLSASPFERLYNLQTLNLEDNELTFLTPLQLRGLFSLQSLNLENNFISTINKYLLLLVSSAITSVNLNGNNISCLPKSIFNDSTEISTISLKNNNLSLPEPDWFGNVVKNNHPEQMDSNALDGNPWTCDCSAYNYWEFLRNGTLDDQWVAKLDIECTRPDHVIGKRLSELSVYYFVQQDCKVAADEECPGQTTKKTSIDFSKYHRLLGFAGVEPEELVTTNATENFLINAEAFTDEAFAEAFTDRDMSITESNMQDNFFSRMGVIFLSVFTIFLFILSGFLIKKFKQRRLSGKRSTSLILPKSDYSLGKPRGLDNATSTDSGFCDQKEFSRISSKKEYYNELADVAEEVKLVPNSSPNIWKSASLSTQEMALSYQSSKFS